MSAAAIALELPPITLDRDCAFAHSAPRQALAYWKSLRGNRDVPGRSEISPSAMRGFLEYVNLVDINPQRPDCYIISLQGSHAYEVLGQLAKRNWQDIFSDMEQDRWRYCFDVVRNHAHPVRVAARVGTKRQTWVDCEMLIAPLSNRGGAMHSFFWVFVSSRR